MLEENRHHDNAPATTAIGEIESR